MNEREQRCETCGYHPYTWEEVCADAQRLGVPTEGKSRASTIIHLMRRALDQIPKSDKLRHARMCPTCHRPILTTRSKD